MDCQTPEPASTTPEPPAPVTEEETSKEEPNTDNMKIEVPKQADKPGQEDKPNLTAVQKATSSRRGSGAPSYLGYKATTSTTTLTTGMSVTYTFCLLMIIFNTFNLYYLCKKSGFYTDNILLFKMRGYQI